MAGKNTAIVLAAGQGKRMHSKIQKQFLEIQGYPVLYYSLRCFQESPLIQDIILVTGEDALSCFLVQRRNRGKIWFYKGFKCNRRRKRTL